MAASASQAGLLRQSAFTPRSAPHHSGDSRVTVQAIQRLMAARARFIHRLDESGEHVCGRNAANAASTFTVKIDNASKSPGILLALARLRS
jgi:ABC-type tungstate transport system permease subunit